MRAVIPPLRPIRKNATQREREIAYREYVDELVALNPGRFLPRGVKRRWWHWQLEHPLTKSDIERG